MFSLPLLDLLTGLFFLFLAFSVLTSSFAAMLAEVFGAKSKFQKERIGKLLGQVDLQGETDRKMSSIIDMFAKQPAILRLYQRPFWQIALLGRPIIFWVKNRFPSEISNDNFYEALASLTINYGTQTGFDETETGTPQNDQLIEAGIIRLQEDGHQLGEILWRLWANSGKDEGEFKKSVIQWYEDFGIESTRLYRVARRPRLLVIGLLLAASVNFDVISLTNELWSNQQLRTAIADAGQTFYNSNREKDPEELTPSDFPATPNTVDLPIGWKQIFADDESKFLDHLDPEHFIWRDTVTFRASTLEALSKLKIVLTDTVNFKHDTSKYYSFPKKIEKGSVDEKRDTTIFDWAEKSHYQLELDPEKWDYKYYESHKKYLSVEKSLNTDFNHLYPCPSPKGCKYKKYNCIKPIWLITKAEYAEKDLGERVTIIKAWLSAHDAETTYKLLGFLLAGFIASAGAPFWYDLLKRFTPLRSKKKA